ncbi:MAG: DUF58 domain-containing protein [Candidatus Dormibacteraceae bacterium]
MRPTPRLFGALVLAAAVEYYGATSEVPWLFLLASWIVAICLASFVYALWNRAGLRAHLRARGAHAASDSCAGELPAHLLREAESPGPIFEGDDLEIEVGLDTTGAPRGPARFVGTVGSKQISVATGMVPRSGWRQAVNLERLGRGPVGARDWVLESSDLAGMFRSRRRSPDVEVALVLPRFAALERRPQTRELEASVAAPRAGSGTELFGVREYRPGDSLRRIHWRSSARHGELVVREYEPPGVQTLGIFCDPSPADPAVADQVARIAASEAWDCIRNGGRVMLWGPGLASSAPREARSFWAALEWLARYPAPAIQGEDADAPRVSEAVAVTGGAHPGVVEALEIVRRRGGKVRAWVVGDSDFDVDGPVQHVSAGWPL